MIRTPVAVYYYDKAGGGLSRLIDPEGRELNRLLEHTLGRISRFSGLLAATDGMTVFGFGRTNGAVPLIRRRQTFFVGFWEEGIASAQTHRDLERHIERLLKP